MKHLKDYKVENGKLLVRDKTSCGKIGKGLVVGRFLIALDRCKECEMNFNKVKIELTPTTEGVRDEDRKSSSYIR